MPIEVLGETPTPRDPREAHREFSSRFPKPSNAVALAALDAFWQAGNASQAISAGLPEKIAHPYLMPMGILPRMRMLAAGYVKGGDKLRPATDTAWWGKAYAHPLWNPLWTYVDQYAKAGLGGNVAWDDGLANGNPSAVSRSLASVAEEIATIIAEKADGCAPYFIPTRRDVLPIPNLACISAIAARKSDPSKLLPKPPSLSLPWWGWVAIGWILMNKSRR